MSKNEVPPDVSMQPGVEEQTDDESEWRLIVSVKSKQKSREKWIPYISVMTDQDRTRPTHLCFHERYYLVR